MRQALLACTVTLLLAQAHAADEISAFRLTDFSAYLDLQYRKDETSNEATGVGTDVDDTRQQIELGMSSISYVFHPKLLRMFISGSLLSDRQVIDREQGPIASADRIVSRSRRDDVLLNIDSRFQFLKDKPFPTTFSYFRDNPVVKTGVEGSFTQQSERYGIDFQLRDILPVHLSVNAFRDSSFGESLDRVIDITADRLSVRARKQLGAGERVILYYEDSDQVSRNGDPRRPIQETARRAQRTSLTSSLRLGADNQLHVDQTASYNRRKDPDVTDINFTPSIRWMHSRVLESRYRYSFSQSDRHENDFRSRTESASAALHYSPAPSFNGSIRADTEQVGESDRFSQKANGLSARANTRTDLKVGQLNLSFGLGYKLHDRVSQTPRISILEEPVTFAGIGAVALSQPFVLAETVEVNNATGTQMYLEGLDYRLIRIGSQTQIERLISGSILDGETVLVDYEADTGGTFEYSQVNQSASADFRFARHHNLFLRYLNNRQNLESGFSTLPFNSVDAVEYGIRENWPLRWGGVQLNGEIRRLEQDEDINPFDQTSFQVSVQAPLPRRIDFSASVSRSIVDNLLSEEDVDLSVFNVNLVWRARRNLALRVDGYYDEDTGGTLSRSATKLMLGAQWRYRKISLRLDARYEQQQQGDLNRDHYELWLQIRRELF